MYVCIFDGDFERVKKNTFITCGANPFNFLNYVLP